MCTDPVDILFWLHMLLFRCLDDFIAMLVGTGLKPHLFSAQSFETAVGIGNYCGIGMTEMRLGIHIIYGSCNVSSHHNFISVTNLVVARIYQNADESSCLVRRVDQPGLLSSFSSFLFFLRIFFFQRLRQFPLFFCQDDILSTTVFSNDCILQRYLTFNQILVTIHLDPFSRLGHILSLFFVGLVFIGQTAQQTIADPGYFGRIERQILLLGHLDRYGIKVFNKRGAAQFTTAGTDTAEHFRFMPDTDLAHFNPGPKLLNQVFDQSPKINPAVGGKIKNHLAAVEITLDPNKMHVQIMLVNQKRTGLKCNLFAFRQVDEFFQLNALGKPVQSG